MSEDQVKVGPWSLPKSTYDRLTREANADMRTRPKETAVLIDEAIDRREELRRRVDGGPASAGGVASVRAAGQ